MSFRLRKFRTSFKIPLYFFRIMFMTTVWHQRERQFILNFTHFTLYWICRCANASIKVFHIDYFIKWKGNLLILLVKILVTPVPKTSEEWMQYVSFIYIYLHDQKCIESFISFTSWKDENWQKISTQSKKTNYQYCNTF